MAMHVIPIPKNVIMKTWSEPVSEGARGNTGKGVLSDVCLSLFDGVDTSPGLQGGVKNTGH